MASNGVHGDYLCLLVLYSGLPDIMSTSPMVDDIIGVICFVLKNIQTLATKNKKYSKIDILELILKLLCSRVIDKKETIYNVTAVLEKELCKCISLGIQSCLMDDPTRCGILLQSMPHIIAFEEELAIQGNRKPPKTKSIFTVKDAGDNSDSDDETLDSTDIVPWKGWMGKPKLEWLLSGEWHDAPPMHNVYSSPAEYGETLLRMWVLLTFQWGAGALRPKCTNQFGGKGGKGGGKGNNGTENNTCGKPLLKICNSGKCRNRGCDNTATWKCHHSNHYDAICDQCLSRTQQVFHLL